MSVYVDHNCLHATFQPHLSSEWYSRKHEKLPEMIIRACNRENDSVEKEGFAPFSGVASFNTTDEQLQ